MSAGEIKLVGYQIQKNIPINTRSIITNSDSLSINGKYLQRNIDYKYDPDLPSFFIINDSIINNITKEDTLVVKYSPVPKWLDKTYGNSLPEQVIGKDKYSFSPRPNLTDRLYSNKDISITGAKTFRFDAQSSGSSSFNQSLDLSISGNINENTIITGSITDRGYTPSYGTVNNRINEFDKINIKLYSPSFLIKVGDIDWRSYHFNNQKSISGASFELTNENYQIKTVAARPKGRFSSSRFYGANNKQGPYRINTGQSIKPVVSNSETVWVDGEKLVRGVNQDYVIDYALGEITFSSNIRIDSRSRIEVDFEPMLTDYRGEFIETGSAVSLYDSSLILSFAWQREADDKDQLMAGSISATDKNILKTIGDDISSAYRSGISYGSGGYNLVIDSLPDSVFVYVGDSFGMFDVQFNYVGHNQGDYLFTGGNRYLYNGKNKGDYLPLIKIPVPQKKEYFQTQLKHNNDATGEFTAELSVSNFDKNLFSSVNDDDNRGTYLYISNFKQWERYNQNNYFRFDIKNKEKKYQTFSRIYSPDFDRKFLVPVNFIFNTDQFVGNVESDLSFVKQGRIKTGYSSVNFDDKFIADLYNTQLIIDLNEKIDITTGYTRVEAALKDSTADYTANSENYTAEIKYKFNNQSHLKADWENDSRQDNYFTSHKGTKYNRYGISFMNNKEQVSYEYYNEDTLLSDWQKNLYRDRFMLKSQRSLFNIDFNNTFSYEIRKDSNSPEKSLLARSEYGYRNRARQLYINGYYALADENRNARGLTYYQVEPGQGDFILENGEYIPDNLGDYLQVDEILSDNAKIKKGEKNFQYRYNIKFVSLKLSTTADEELHRDGRRKIIWLLPFYSDKSQPYLFYRQQDNYDIRLFPQNGSHRIIFTINSNVEYREINNTLRRRNDKQYNLTFQQIVNDIYIHEKMDWYDYERDAYYSGGGIFEGYKISLGIKYLFDNYELGLEGGYRKMENSQGRQSIQNSITGITKIKFNQHGEILYSIEIYNQDLSNNWEETSYVLTDSKLGNKGAIWKSTYKIRINKDFRIDMSLTGKHDNSHRSRITGRGEIIAGF